MSQFFPYRASSEFNLFKKHFIPNSTKQYKIEDFFTGIFKYRSLVVFLFIRLMILLLLLVLLIPAYYAFNLCFFALFWFWMATHLQNK